MSRPTVHSCTLRLDTWAAARGLGNRALEDLAPQLFEVLQSRQSGAPAALLDSSDHAQTDQPQRSARSILAFSFGPHAAEVSHDRGWTTMSTAEQTHRRRESFFSWLRENWMAAGSAGPGSAGPDSADPDSAGPAHHDGSTCCMPSADGSPRFRLGWVGWLGYELSRETGAAEPPRGDRTGLPGEQARLFRATHAVIIHHREGLLEMQWLAGPEQAAESEDCPGTRTEWTAAVVAALQDALGGDHQACAQTVQLSGLKVRDSREDYLAAIAAAQREIFQGNSYEICLTTAVTGIATAPSGTFSSAAAFGALRRQNRAPFTQILSFPGTDILSTSPERFLSIDAAGLVRSEPIKGTRPRGRTPEQDRALIQDLRTHPKDRAENVMITDLVRNDLSVHAIPGTLRTERLCAVETYPTVHQMVSTISAQVASGTSGADVVAHAFPPGSMTGAPKISTMDILQRLESGPRGPYSGVAGYFSTDGAADLSVLIRTAVLTGSGDVRTFHLGLGGAITADSDPESEWEEVRTKSQGVLRALGASFPDAKAVEAAQGDQISAESADAEAAQGPGQDSAGPRRS